MSVNHPPHSGANLRDSIPEEDAHEVANELYDRAGRAVSVLRYWRDALERGDQEAIRPDSLDCLAAALERGFGLPGGVCFHFPDYEERRHGSFEATVGRSSFGTPEARAAMQSVDDATAERITSRAEAIRLHSVLADLVAFTERHAFSDRSHDHDCREEWARLRDEAEALLDAPLRRDDEDWASYWRGLSPEERAEEDQMMRQHTADEIRRAEMEGGDA